MRRVLAGVLALTAMLAACRDQPRPATGERAGSSRDPGSPRDAGAAVGPRDNASWLLAWQPIDSRFAELRDAASLRCLLASNTYVATEQIAIDAPPALARIAAFAVVELARPNGDTPTLMALGDAVGLLARVDDVDGLRLAFAAADAIPMPPRWSDDDVAYRARVGLAVDLDANRHVRLDVIRELALAGATAEAARLLDTVVTADDTESAYQRRDLVAALVALDRVDAARDAIAGEAAVDRADVAAAGLDVAIRTRRGVALAVTAVIAALALRDGTGRYWSSQRTLQAARRAGLARDLAPLRRAIQRGWSVADRPRIGGLIDTVFDEVVASGDAAERAALLPMVDPAHAAFVTALHDGTLDEALARARPKLLVHDLARVWVRHVAEGASPAFEARLAAAACPAGAAVAAGPPVAAEPGVALVVASRTPRPLRACGGTELALRLVRDGQVVDDTELDGSCHGACTAAEKRDGERELRRLQRQIDRGEISEGATDYNFTGCLFAGPRAGRTERVAGRDVAIVIEHYIGAHDIDQDRFLLALEVCGALHVSSRFAETYAMGWGLDQLSISASPDGREIRVTGSRDGWRGAVIRLTLPSTCPGAPVEVVVPAE